jgi:flagellar basal body-associated protein FliL
MVREDAVPKSKKSSPVFMIIVLLVFGLIVGGVGLYRYNLGKKSASWLAVKGKMTYARAVPATVNKKQEYRLSVKYRYIVDGKSYTGERITVSDNFQKTRSLANDVLKKYPVGGEVSVYYSPADPGSSVLKTGVNKNVFLPLGIAVVCFLLATAIIVSEAKKKRLV